MKKQREEFDVNLGSGSNKLARTLAIIIVIFLIVIIAFRALFIFLDSSITQQYEQDMLKGVTGNENQKIYNFEDIVYDKDLAQESDYVKADYREILYSGIDKSAIIYYDEKNPDDSMLWELIYVEYFVDYDGSIYSIDSCYDSYEDIGYNLDACLVSGTNYIISYPNKAIIQEDVFFNKYYGNLEPKHI
ncbi:hypothetical protein LJB88_03080 [Erysipelotrichaceae bacterium OttesenSCG-928-M19]|nr:hypothetical protein [Erysipelotrichaceae bacterium OttesenSCG-928-M19]